MTETETPALPISRRVSFHASLKSGRWLTAERVSVYPLLFLAVYIIAFGALFATADGRRDAFGKPLGTDFVSFYSAGTLAVEGTPAGAYEPQVLHETERALLGGGEVEFFAFQYPPIFLLIIAPLALAPYLVALLIWQMATLAAYAGVALRILPRWQAAAAALAAPAAFLTFGHGQTAFLTTALIGGALLALQRRPVLAGVLIGCLAFKPQLAVLFPLVLAVGGHWRAFFAAAATVAALIAASFIAFGEAPWRLFLEGTALSRTALLEEGAIGWQKIPTLFAALRAWGAALGTAYAAQGALSAAAALALAVLWWRPVARELKYAGFAVATLLALPFYADYELVLLSLPIAWLAAYGLREGFLPYEVSLLAAAWIMPFFVRPLGSAASLPIGLAVTTALFVLILVKAAAGRAHTATAAHKAAPAAESVEPR